MTDNEKVPYIQCLCHTGKKVYKYWLIALAAIGVIIGCGWGIIQAWKQITDFVSAVGNVLNSIGYVLFTLLNNVWMLVLSVPWYLWLITGAIAGPFILVAIYCAVKHYGVKGVDVFIFIVILIMIVAFWGIINFVIHFSQRSVDTVSLVGAICSVAWLCAMGCAIGCLGDN